MRLNEGYRPKNYCCSVQSLAVDFQISSVRYNSVMEDMHQKRTGVRRILYIAQAIVLYGFDRALEIFGQDISIIKREGDLFFGVLLTTIGIFHFRSDKFCDGNSVDYLSCTRPTSYHYYGGLEIFLIVVGSFFILLWFLKRRRID